MPLALNHAAIAGDHPKPIGFRFRVDVLKESMVKTVVLARAQTSARLGIAATQVVFQRDKGAPTVTSARDTGATVDAVNNHQATKALPHRQREGNRSTHA
jgi:hypothetical protein